MANKNAQEFMELLRKDEKLQEKIKTATDAYTGNKANEKALFDAVIAPVAKEAGFEFTFEDAAELTKSSEEELSEEELASVAGGSAGVCFIVGVTEGSSSDDAHMCCGAGIGFKDL